LLFLVNLKFSHFGTGLSVPCNLLFKIVFLLGESSNNNTHLVVLPFSHLHVRFVLSTLLIALVEVLSESAAVDGQLLNFRVKVSVLLGCLAQIELVGGYFLSVEVQVQIQLNETQLELLLLLDERIVSSAA